MPVGRPIGDRPGMDNQRRDRGRSGGGRFEDNAPRKPEPKRDPGAYIGRMPERSIANPGGFGQRGGPGASVAQPSTTRNETKAEPTPTPESTPDVAKATNGANPEAGQTP